MADLFIIAVGSLRDKYFRDAADEYIKRLSASWNVHEVEIKEERLSASPTAAEISAALQKEGERIAAAIPKRAYSVALCVEGFAPDSVGFSSLLGDAKTAGYSSVCFIIGSANGLSEKVKEACQCRLSMSRMTFPHRLARVMLLEAVYRATEIGRGSGYHK